MSAERDSQHDDAGNEVEAEVDAERATDDEEPTQPKVGGMTRRIRPARISIAWLLAVLVVASMSLAAWLFFFHYRPDQQTNTAAADTVTKAASDGTALLLTYSPKTIDRDLTTAKSHLTGDFLTYYTNFTDQVVAPAAKQKEVQATANVVKAAVSELHSDSAVVLLFVNQTTVSKERPTPALSASSIKVTLSKVNGAWLISKFEPQ